MINKNQKKILASNFIALSVLQSANYLLPLLTIPYLARVLEPDYFGLVAFSTAMTMYFMIITDYGFNLSATRQISLCRDDEEKLSDIFSSVMIIKGCLMLFCLSLLLLIVFSFDMFSQHWELYVASFGMVVGQVLFPIWLFQGMERMRYIAYLNLFSKMFFTLCIFIFVKEKSDYLLVPLLTSLGYMFAGIWSLYFVSKEFNVVFSLQDRHMLKFQLLEGWHVFVSGLAVSLYTVSSIFVLGVFTNSVTVGNFAAAEKIIFALKGLFSPV